MLDCFIEVDMEEKKFDDACWEPNIRHQGLVLEVSTWESLEGYCLKWDDSNDPSYTQPEIGIIYVFGHAQTTNNKLQFGKAEDGEIKITWSGCNELFWGGEYGENVPFTLETKLKIENA